MDPQDDIAPQSSLLSSKRKLNRTNEEESRSKRLKPLQKKVDFSIDDSMPSVVRPLQKVGDKQKLKRPLRPIGNTTQTTLATTLNNALNETDASVLELSRLNLDLTVDAVEEEEG